MRRFFAVAWLICFLALPLVSQQKVAEGVYQMLNPAGAKGSQAKAVSRWVLYGGKSGGYRFESEIQNMPNGVRIRQLEDLDSRMIPATLAYEFYNRGVSTPEITLACRIANESVICAGQSKNGRAADSEPFQPGGPFCLWVRDFSGVDIAWLFAGAVNMALLPDKNASVKMASVSGGVALVLSDKLNVSFLEAAKQPGQKITVVAPENYTDWDFTVDEDSALVFVGAEKVDVGGTSVATRHYTIGMGENATNLWITSAGVPIKSSSGGDNSYVVLGEYKQFAKLVPEIRVEKGPAAAPTK